MKYPKNIIFTPFQDGTNARYILNSNYNLDLWGICYLLNERKFKLGTSNIVDLDFRDQTMILRSYFLPKIIKNITFMPDSSLKAESIIRKINEGIYKTYSCEYPFKERGTKDKTESKLEKDIFNNLNKYFPDEFVFSGHDRGLRQFPANIFDGEPCEKSRISRKFWVDILTVNKNNQLSVIELKAGKNNPLDLFIQVIDYGIFCHLFKRHISDYKFISNKQIVRNKVAVYLIAESFHPALIGDNKHKSLISIIQQNEILDVIIIEIRRRKSGVKEIKRHLDTRALCNS